MKHKSALFIFPSSELLACSLVRAETTYTPDNKIAYGANLGWVNLARPRDRWSGGGRVLSLRQGLRS